MKLPTALALCLCLFALLCLTACAPAPVKEKTVTLRELVYVPVPASLAADCPHAVLPEPACTLAGVGVFCVRQLVDMLKDEQAAIDACNVGKSAIRALGAPDAK